MRDAAPPAWLPQVLKPLAAPLREVVALSLFINLLALAVPIFSLQVYDRVVFHAGLTTLTALALGMALVVVFDFILRQARARIVQTAAVHIDVAVGRRLFDAVATLPLEVLEARPTGHWLALYRDAEQIRTTLSGTALLLACDLPFAVLFLGLVVVIAPPVAVVLLIALPAFVLLAWRSGRMMAATAAGECQDARARDAVVAEVIAGRTTVKALGLDRALRPAWEDRHAAAIEDAVRRGARADGYTNLATTLAIATQVTMTTAGAVAILDQTLSIGALIAAGMLSGRITGPLAQLVGNWRAYAGFGAAARRLGSTFALIPPPPAADAVRLGRPEGRLRLEGVCFRYPDATAPAIDRLDLALPARGLTGLIGRNGSGKSTLLKLILGLYRPQAGRILVDDADIAQFGPAELAAAIGYVPQTTVLFGGSIRDAIAQRDPAAGDDAIIAAARAAGAHPGIVDLPEGYATPVGEGGVRLSAGQRQRIAIARALLSDPPILLLDEPTAALDRGAERALRDGLAALARTRTIIVVTHSPVLLAACTRMIVLERGRLVSAGPSALAHPHPKSPHPETPPPESPPPWASPAASLRPDATLTVADPRAP